MFIVVIYTLWESARRGTKYTSDTHTLEAKFALQQRCSVDPYTRTTTFRGEIVRGKTERFIPNAKFFMCE